MSAIAKQLDTNDPASSETSADPFSGAVGNAEIANISIEDGRYTYEYKCSLKKGKPLIVFLPAAQSADKRRNPYYSRWQWCDQKDYSAIAVSDPTLCLDETMLGGWFQGTADGEFQIAAIVRHVERVLAAIEMGSHDVVFAGSSMGGFAAIMAAIELRGSAAYAELPQTNFRVYGQTGAREAVARQCYGRDTLEEVGSEFDIRLSVMTASENARYVPPVYYVQKPSDYHHWRHHYLPFQDFVNRMCRNPEIDVSQVVFDIAKNIGGEGHTALPRQEAMARIARCFHLARTTADVQG